MKSPTLRRLGFLEPWDDAESRDVDMASCRSCHRQEDGEVCDSPEAYEDESATVADGFLM
jgi:hypothetical protein